MILFNEVISGTERHQMGVISGCGNGNRSGASDVSVTQLVGQALQVISREHVVVPKDVIVRRSACSLCVRREKNDMSIR